MGLNRKTFLCFAVLILAVCSLGQDVPEGVTYKKAPPETNAKAKAALESALKATDPPTALLGGAGVTSGPILWSDLEKDHEGLSKDSTPVDMFLSIPEPLHAQGRGFRTQEQRQRFWKLVLEHHPDLRDGVVRPARANEIKFYWATIPFDIEEPFFAIETPKNVFVVNLRMEKDTPVLFWLDRVDELHKLKK